MDVGRWYKDNSGQEFRYIGTSNDESIGLFSDGEKTFKKSLSDFENVPKEKKLFGFFKKGGITANDLLEARSFFGEGEWKKLTREDRIKSARYLKRTGKIGYKKGGKINQGDLPDFISMQYDKGGKMGRYTVNVYYGGEMGNEEIYTDSLAEAKKISQQGEHSEIYDNVKKVFIEEYADGGELDEDSLDYNSISDLQSERNRLVRWKYQYNSKGADYKIKQLEERIEYLKSKDSKMADGGTINDYLSSRGQMNEHLDYFDNALTKKDVIEFIKLSKDSDKKYWIRDSTGFSKFLYKGQLRANDSVEGIFKATKIGVDRLNDSLKYRIMEEELFGYEKEQVPYLDQNQKLKEIPKNSINKDWSKYVNDNSGYLKIEEETEDTIQLATRKNGNVGDEEYSQKDVQEAKDVYNKIKEKYPNTKAKLYNVDEWVYLELTYIDKMADGGQIEKVYELILKNPNGGMTRRVLLMAKTKDEASNKALKLKEFKGMGWVVKSVDEDKYAKGGRLVGKQKNLDLNKNGKLDSEDFKMLRRRKMSKGGTLDYSKISNIEVEGIDKNDYPDFSDAYIYYAEYDGEPMTDKQIEELNENGEFVYEQIHRRLYARGGMLKDNLEKELNRLLRQINSPRLSVYTKGDTSEEEMSRRRERASKIARKDEILRVLNEMDSKMAKGGRTKFQDKADAIADSLEGKKVAPKYRKQYGAKYDRSEAEMAGKRIAGAMRKKYGI
jgi:hypothetical protein